MARRAKPQAGLRPAADGRVEVRHVSSPVELLTVPPEAAAWAEPARWVGDYDAVEPGTIVRLRPPHAARTNPEVVRAARDHFAGRGARVRVEPAAAAPVLPAEEQRTEAPATHREVVEQVLRAATAPDAAALRELVVKTMDEEGL